MPGKEVRDTLGLLAVVASLVFVGVEIRQNTAVARTQARNDLATLNQEWLMQLAADLDLSEDFDAHFSYEEPRDLSATEEIRANRVMVVLLRRLENAYLLFEEGLIPESALTSYGMQGPWFSSTQFRSVFWPSFKSAADPSFVEFAESTWGL